MGGSRYRRCYYRDPNICAFDRHCGSAEDAVPAEGHGRAIFRA